VLEESNDVQKVALIAKSWWSNNNGKVKRARFQLRLVASRDRNLPCISMDGMS